MEYSNPQLAIHNAMVGKDLLPPVAGYFEEKVFTESAWGAVRWRRPVLAAWPAWPGVYYCPLYHVRSLASLCYLTFNCCQFKFKLVISIISLLIIINLISIYLQLCH